MNAREKRLALAVGGLVAVFLGGFLIQQILVKPLRKAAQEADAVESQLGKLKQERRAFFGAEDELREMAARTFAGEVDLASALSGELLTRLIVASGLRETDFSRLPFGPQVPRGAREIGWELGWAIQGSGELSKVVNLLFLLQQSPQLHRLENVVVSSGTGPGQVKVQLKYLTLVIRSEPEVERTNDLGWIAMAQADRALYDPIVQRDVLSPYIPPAPPPAPPPATAPGTSPAPPPVPPGPGPETFRVVSLSEWNGQSEIQIRDMTGNTMHRYKPGDELAGGVIVKVDYRSLPRPGQEYLLSHSRVILKVADEFWAVERGHTLAQMYRMPAELLP